jgi:molybdopterin converting factor small subunit
MLDDHHAPPRPTLRIALFAGMAEVAGARHIELPWSGGSVAELRRAVGEAYPSLGPLLARSRIAVDDCYVADDTAVPAAADVACIPPVSGG